MTELVVRIAGDPQPQNAGKVGRWKAKDGRTGTVIRQPSKVIKYKLEAEERMHRAAVDAGLRKPDSRESAFGGQALEVHILAVFACPTSDHRKRDPVPRRPHTGARDLDNLTKALGDAGAGVLWDNDGQICRLVAEKWIGAQGELPYVEIRVRLFNPAIATAPPIPFPNDSPRLFD